MVDATAEILRTNGRLRVFDNQERERRYNKIDFLTVGEGALPRGYLASLFDTPNWKVVHAADCDEAARTIGSRAVAVVVTNEVLPDGTWRDVAHAIGDVRDAPALIVAADGEMPWGDVVHMGGYDLLTPPLRESHVLWSAASAWHHWMKNREQIGPDGK